MVTISVAVGCKTGNLTAVAGSDNNDPIIETASVLGAYDSTLFLFHSIHFISIAYKISIVPRYPDCLILH